MSKAFGEQNPSAGEDAVSWQTWSDGNGGIPETTIDADWGKLKLPFNPTHQGRSAVYNLGASVSRKFTITENRYGTGTEDATLYIRGDTVAFLQDDISPLWTPYAGAITETWQYVQIMALPIGVLGTLYYVANAPIGNDSNDGLSPATPWETITKVNAASLVAGDHVLFKAGETFAGKLVPAINGSTDHPIVYGTYGSGARPIIDGSADVALYIVLGANRSHLRYENIDFSGSTGGTLSFPTVRAQGNNLYFYNCIFRDSTSSYGFYAFDTGSGENIHHITLDTCQAYNNYASGIHTGSGLGTLGPHDILIKNCIAHDNGATLYSDHGIYIRHGAVIEGCIAYNNVFGSGIKVNCEGVHDSPYTPIVRNCISYGNHEGMTLDNVRAIIYNNLVYANIFQAAPLNSDGSDSLIYHNTFVNSTTTTTGLISFLGSSPPTGIIFKNNIFVQDAAVYNIFVMNSTAGTTLATIASTNTFDYNAYYHGDASIFYDTTTRSWADWQGYGAEAHGAVLAGLPDFVTRYSDFHPANAGNLDGHDGIAIVGYMVDMDGNVRADPPNYGCYEEASA